MPITAELAELIELWRSLDDAGRRGLLAEARRLAAVAVAEGATARR